MARRFYSIEIERRAAFFSAWWDLSASILFFARRERFRFCRRIFSISARCAATKPFFRFNFVEQQPARDEAVESLLAGFLAFHLTRRSDGATT